MHAAGQEKGGKAVPFVGENKGQRSVHPQSWKVRLALCEGWGQMGA